jgi:parallel beta-helix repeat protein
MGSLHHQTVNVVQRLSLSWKETFQSVLGKENFWEPDLQNSLAKAIMNVSPKRMPAPGPALLPRWMLVLRPFFPTEMDATVAPNGVVGNSNTADIAIETGYCAANNRIHHNTFENGAEGVFTYSCDNTQIYSNTFQNLSDCGVLASDAKQVDFHRKSTQDGPRVASMSDQGRVAIKQ